MLHSIAVDAPPVMGFGQVDRILIYDCILPARITQNLHTFSIVRTIFIKQHCCPISIVPDGTAYGGMFNGILSVKDYA